MPPSRPNTTASSWVARAEVARTQVLQVGDEPSVHELRVALARVRAWLWLGGEVRLARRVRELRRSAGPLRDVDVVSSLGGLRQDAERLRGERSGLLEELQSQLVRPKVVRLLTALRSLPPLDEDRVRRRLAVALRRCLERGDARACAAGRRAALHALRRSARRVRFGLELLGADARVPKRLQSALGAVCDLDLALEHGAGTTGSRELLERRRAVAFRQALQVWWTVRPALASLLEQSAHAPSR